MTNIEELSKTWNNEAKSYQFSNDSQVDYLANYYHLLKALGNIKNKHILEVGSGTGQSSAYLATKGAIVYLVDISSRSLKFSKKYFTQKNLSAHLFQQDAFNMKFPDESFDCVWNGGVIEHFSDEEKILMIKKMWKLVKPGGKLLINVPNSHDFIFMIAKKILQVRKKWTFGEEDDLSIKRMRGLISKAGIKDYTIYAYNPIVGFWFLPYGRELTEMLGFNTLKYLKKKTPNGHVILFYAKKQ